MSSSHNEGPEEASTDTRDNPSKNWSNESIDPQDVDSTSLRSFGCSPNTSRYGRTIRPKLPSNMSLLFPPIGSPPTPKRESPKMSSQASPRESLSKTSAVEAATESDNSSVQNEDGSDCCSESNTESVPIECKWRVGQLAWARIGSFPFWPCTVTLEPVTLTHHRQQHFGRMTRTAIHVRYFGDKGRRNWVPGIAMIPFTGLADFRALAAAVTPEIRKKDPKYAAAFEIRQKGIRRKWDRAVEEAMDVFSMSIEDRADLYMPYSKPARSSAQKKLTTTPKPRSRKRRFSQEDSEAPAPKQSKQDSNDSEAESEEKLEKPKSRKQKRDSEAKSEIGLGANTPPTPPSSHKDSSDEAPALQRAKPKRLKRSAPNLGDFEIYYERNRDRIEDEQPDATEAEIRRYLKKTWNSMSASVKSTYQGRLKPQAPSAEDESSSEEEESNSTTSDEQKKSTSDKSDATATDGNGTKRKRPYNLFKGMKSERVCQICEKAGKLTRCRGPCYSYFHLPCVKPGESSPEPSLDGNVTEDESDTYKVAKTPSSNYDDAKEEECDDEAIEDKSDDPIEPSEEEIFKCIDCLSGVAPACFLCNGRERERIRCNMYACGRHYHPECLKPWPQSNWQGGRLTCPYHICHTCSSDNPRGCNLRSANEKLVRCVRCPSSYHPSISCIPAGSGILTGSQIICPKHHRTTNQPMNAAWCFLCTKGGSLICCDTCPTSFHPECLGIDAPEDAFICEDCETGRLPLYGEIVWVKLGHYRWWPSRICYPNEIPQNVMVIPHSPGEFCVMFLGSKDYYWVNRGRAFLYQDGDANTKASAGKKNVDEAYRMALQEAQELHQSLKEERAAVKDNDQRGLKPPPYVKLKINKPVGNVKPSEVESIAACECDPDWENPCAPDTDCLNRILSVECSPGICPAGAKCKNQAFVRRQYPSMEPFHTAGRGWGLRSLEAIISGQFVIEYVGEVIDEAEYRSRLQRKKELKEENFYFLTIDNYRMIDAEPKGNLSRFMNHSCQPNCETQKWTVNGDTRIGLFALRDIEAGEELTFNYNLACDGETRKPCLCGAPNCSGFIGLKVQKLQQLPPPVTPKPFKIKRQRRSGRTVSCWGCAQEISDTNDQVQCHQKTCNKRYHKSCVTIEDGVSRFSCPWHHCAECGRRTSAHCSFCSAAYCQVHLDGNLSEYKQKGRLICGSHGSSTDFDKDDSDDTDPDKDESPNSPGLPEKPPQRVPSPRVSIVEVNMSSEEGEESQKEEDDETVEETRKPETRVLAVHEVVSKPPPVSRRFSLRKQRREEAARTLNALTSSQLAAIIGGSVNERGDETVDQRA